MQRHVRLIATFLAFTLCWDGFAHAARPSRRLAMLQAAMQIPTAPAASAPRQQQVPAPTGGVPAGTSAATAGPDSTGIRDRLRLAHKVLLTNTGNDPYFALSGDDTLNAVLDALNRWGRYQIVTDVNQADLVIQLHGVAIPTDTGATPTDPTSSVIYMSSVQVTVADPHTLAPLWVTHIRVQHAVRQKSREKNTALLGDDVASQLKLLAGDTLSPQEKAQLKQANSNHVGRFVLIGAGGVALSLGLFFIARHAMKQNQASFCQQNGISPCPGS